MQIFSLSETLQALEWERFSKAPACQVPANAAPVSFQMSKLYIPIIPEVEPLLHESFSVTCRKDDSCQDPHLDVAALTSGHAVRRLKATFLNQSDLEWSSLAKHSLTFYNDIYRLLGPPSFRLP